MGDIKTSNLLLGKEYQIKGTQIRGQGLGSKDFVPTINLQVDEYLLPNEGVYATKTIINEQEYNSISFLGHRVTTDNSYAVETHILDKEIKNQTKDISIKFVEQIRINQKFDNFIDLKNQILIDINDAKNIFDSLENQ